MFVRLLKLPAEVRGRYDVSSLRLCHPRRRAVPGPGEAADDRVVRAGRPRVLRRHRGQRLRVLQQRDVAGPRGHRRHADRLRRPHLRRRRRGAAARRGAAPCTSRVAPRSSTTTTPEKTASSRHPNGLDHARRRRLPRRRQLPVPHRPQGVHDHLRWREHLPAGGRERPGHPSRRSSTSPCSACPTTSSARRSRRSSSRSTMPADGRRRRRRWPRADRATAASQLADVKCPRSIDFREELPRHPTGKLYKRLLKDEYWKGRPQSDRDCAGDSAISESIGRCWSVGAIRRGSSAKRAGSRARPKIGFCFAGDDRLRSAPPCPRTRSHRRIRWCRSNRRGRSIDELTGLHRGPGT